MTLIEDSIIAYFDNRLSAAERAELLGQVSGDPKLRQLFEQHRSMRMRLARAQTNIAVQPHVEDALLARIAALAPSTAAPPTPYLTHILPHVMYAAVAIVAVIASVYFFLPSQHAAPMQFAAHASAASDFGSFLKSSALKSSVLKYSTIAPSYQGQTVSMPANGTVLRQSMPNLHTAVISPPTIAEAPLPLATITGAAVRQIQAAPNAPIGMMPPDRIAMSALAERNELRSQRYSTIQFKVQGVDGTVYPNGMHHLWDVSGARISVGYFLSNDNSVGVRVASYSVRIPPSIEVQQALKLDHQDSLPMATHYAAEMYLEHRALVLNGRLFLTAGVGAGVVAHGGLVSAELGAQIPITDRLQCGFTFALSGTHSTEALQYFDVADNAVKMHNANSINTQLYYGLSYEF